MSLADRLSGRRVVIAGDVMLDRFLFGRVDRISPEAPVPVLTFEREERRLGGAANVAANVRALGGHPVLIGIVGDDEWGAQLRRDVEAAGIDAVLVTDPARPTTCKVRLATSRNQQVARVDYESDDDVDETRTGELRTATLAAVRDCGAVVFSDYLKGALTASLFEEAAEVCRALRVHVVADPKRSDASRYRGATVLTPNHHEAEAMVRRRLRTDADVAAAAREIQRMSDARGVLVTRGEHGMWVLDGEQERALPAAAREVADVTGAGDTVAAAVALGLAAGLTLLEAADLANRAAAVVVGKFGAATATVEELTRTGSRSATSPAVQFLR